MYKKWFIIGLLICLFDVNAQVKVDSVDTRYREDQIYIALSYNLMNNKPDSDSNALFSGGFNVGYILDVPLNKRRNAGIGIGLGYSYNSYSNSFLLDVEEKFTTYETSRFKTQLFEMPIELRWRTSTASVYHFWRIYAGMKFSYLFYSNSKFKLNEEFFEFKNIKALEKFQYGLTLSAGYGSWNLYVYYGLSPLFNNVIVDDKKLNMKDFNLGLKFYIL
ncbi:porin family protein [Lutibacter holmesii]|uniref:Porin family protein n=1 Tax=Lutibacter holmesii TaxID=1137985 RepID=A0ABW3WMV3_9FLAO